MSNEIRALPMVCVMFIAGCATGGGSQREEIGTVYRQLTVVFENCMKVTSYKESPNCFKEQIEYLKKMPAHAGQNPAIKLWARGYQLQAELVAGKRTQREADAMFEVFAAEARVETQREYVQERQLELGRSAAITKALSDFSKATAQPPSINCISSPLPAGGYSSTCR